MGNDMGMEEGSAKKVKPRNSRINRGSGEGKILRQ